VKIGGNGVSPLPNTTIMRTIMRTILASEFITDELLNRFATVDEAASSLKSCFPTFSHWLLECRTFSFGFPRQTHKTTTLLKYVTASTVMIVPNHRMREYAVKDNRHLSNHIHTPHSFVKGVNVPIARIFMDDLNIVESGQMAAIYSAINDMNENGQIASNVFILKVGTPVR
jgi:hypothetical protein